MLIAQTFSCVCLSIWAMIATLLILWIVDRITPIRVSAEEEALGCDITEHTKAKKSDEKNLIAEELGRRPSLHMVNIATANTFIMKDENLTKRIPFGINLGFEHDSSNERF